jgi:hypothetical protein
VVGEHDGYSGKLAFHFGTIVNNDGDQDQILIVTVLSREKIKKQE